MGKQIFIIWNWRLSGMTEREKMINGELYDPTDKEFEQLRLNARKLSRKYNLMTKIAQKSKCRY